MSEQCPTPDPAGPPAPEARAVTDAEPRVCWMCKRPGATVETAPQAPDWQAWWFHEACYWKLQDILY